MTLQDDPDYITDDVHQKFFPPKVIAISRWTQTSLAFEDLFGTAILDNEPVPETDSKVIPRSISEISLPESFPEVSTLQEESVRRPVVRKPEMKDQSTWTKEDEHLTRRPSPKALQKVRCKAMGPSVRPEERAPKCEPIKEMLKALGPQCKPLGSTLKVTERL